MALQTVTQAPPVVHTVVQKVVENHTVVVNNLAHVLGQLIVLIPTLAAISLVHWILERDRLSSTQNTVLVWVYSAVAALVFVTVNHYVDWSHLELTDTTGFLVAFAAAAGSAQKTYDLLKAVTAAKLAKASEVEATPETEAVVNP